MLQTIAGIAKTIQLMYSTLKQGLETINFVMQKIVEYIPYLKILMIAMIAFLVLGVILLFVMCIRLDNLKKALDEITKQKALAEFNAKVAVKNGDVDYQLNQAQNCNDTKHAVLRHTDVLQQIESL